MPKLDVSRRKSLLKEIAANTSGSLLNLTTRLDSGLIEYYKLRLRQAGLSLYVKN